MGWLADILLTRMKPTPSDLARALRAERAKVTKLDAARRQLQTAIELWFNDGDPVSIHTLACASHQIIHDINIKRGKEDLVFDSAIIKDEHRKEFNDLIRKDMTFFKHGDKDPDGITEFASRLSELFMAMSIHGLDSLGESPNDSELAFLYRLTIHNSQFLSETGRKLFDSIPVDELNHLRTSTKTEFYQAFLHARAQARASGVVR